MSREIHIAPLGKLLAYVCLDDGQLNDFFVTTQKGSMDVGAIYLAKADRIIKGSGGMFVKLGDQTGFLRTKKAVPAGKLIPVQVVQYANHDKPMRVSDQLDFRGRFVVLTPGREGINQSRKATREILTDAQKSELSKCLGADCGLVLRSEAEFAEFEELKSDVQKQVARLEKVYSAKDPGLVFAADTREDRAFAEWGYGEVISHEEALPDHVKDALSDSLIHPISLPSGGKVFIEQTRALIAVDVNTGENTKPNAARDVNREAVRAIAGWIKLMGWGGQLVVDFAPMPGSAQKPLAESFTKASREVGLGFTPRGFGPIGLMEGTIKYARMPISAKVLDLI